MGFKKKKKRIGCQNMTTELQLTLFMDIYRTTTMKPEANLIYTDVTFKNVFYFSSLFKHLLRNPEQQNSGQSRL